MKKIMFNDRLLLTDAVLDGEKTMTRRLVGNRMTKWDIEAYQKGYTEVAWKASPYKIGDVVAVAQSGKEIYNQLQQRYGNTSDAALGFMEMYKGLAMWRNKMFVPADLCPNKICITDIKVERLQDISSEDAFREGITVYCSAPRAAFAALIDKVCSKGTWELNPFVFAYSFKLIK